MTQPSSDVPVDNRPDYEQVYDQFWRSIVENPDGTLNREQVMKELHDFHFMMGEVPTVYSHITGGMWSKPTYYAHDVTVEADAYYDRCAKEWAADDLQALLDRGATREQIETRIADLREQVKR